MDDQVLVAADLSRANSAKPRLILVAEYYGSGGTRFYLKQLLEFYASREVWICLVGTHLTPDAEIQELLSKHGFAYVSYSAVMSSTVHSPEPSRPPVWWPPSVRQERRAFTKFLRRIQASAIVVSAGTPGQFLGAAGAGDGIYLLHTYPHGRRQQVLARLVLAPFAQSVKTFVAVSKYEQRAIETLWRVGRADKRIAVVPNTAGPVRGDDAATPEAPPLVITAAWVEAYKEPLEWVEIAEAVSQRMGRQNVQFVWFGEGSMLEACKTAANRIQDVADVRFAGHVAEMEAVYRKATLYLQPSSTENMSLSVIDALRFGLPAIGTQVGGLPEIIEDEVTGVLVPQHDVRAAAAAIVRLLRDTETRLAMSAASRARYAEHFSESHWHRQLDHVHRITFDSWKSIHDGS